MADYKWSGQEETDGVKRYADGASIPNAMGNRDWREYLVYVDGGGLTDPWRTEAQEIEDLRSERYNETPPEYVRRIEIGTGKTYKGVNWEHAQYSRVLNLKIDGTATGGQLALLATVDATRDNLEALQDYIEDVARTKVELQDLDVTDDSWWV